MSMVGDIGTVAAPTVVAVAALWFNNRSQRASRDHDRIERQKERDHERAMRDLDYQRALMDDVAVALEDANGALARLMTPIKARGAAPDQATVEAAGNAASALRLASARLALRLGADHRLVRLIQEGQDAMLAAAATVGVFVLQRGDRAVADRSLDDSYRRLNSTIAGFSMLVGASIGATPRPTSEGSPLQAEAPR